MTAVQTLPTLDLDPFDPEVLRDPLPAHAALRDAGPLVRLPRYDTYAIARYDDVRAALSDWQSFESSAGVGLTNFRTETPWRPPSLLLEADPPGHDAPRTVLAGILGPRALRRLREDWAADAERLVSDLLAGGSAEVDAVPALAEAFPLRVFPDAVGLGRDGREHLLPYGDHAFNAFGPTDNALVLAGNADVAEHSGWVGEQCRRENLAPVGFGADIWAAADRGDLTHAQAPLVVRSLLTAGVDTTVHGIGAVLHALATTPGAWDLLRARPELVRGAFDEAVRWESPVQAFFRTTVRDVPVGRDGAVLPAGQKVLVFFAAANRDPHHWTDPDTFDPTRDPSGHVGFGMGIHQCVGQHVARLEAESLLTALLTRVTRLELTGEPVRHLNNTLRAWASLPMRLTI
ncbi:cytochrome P450 [Pseudonocardia sediminis]|uniref:Cytochrome P450 n=1 Tax=Pseudonocardia sediminis TaxID=1397368 RepID=A0A4Q7UZZ7_PSEST|nr:cytochrome P450 [Pseudonocardia sediminis]RZT85789.1 cytochrome P450 [Pseudonocardia sediminis]